MTATYGVLSNTTYASRTNTTITAPASIGNGDLLFLVHITINNGAGVTQTLPAGFTQIGTAQTGTESTFNYRVVMATKIAASESGDYTVTHAVCNAAGLIVRVDGTNTLSVDVFSQAGGGSGISATATATTVTPTTADDLLFYVGLNWDAAARTPPTGMTERLDSAIVYLASQALASAAATGDKTVNMASSAIYFANLVAIKDVAAGSTPKTQVRVGGVWKPATTFVNVAGTWKQATPYVKVAGTWKPL